MSKILPVRVVLDTNILISSIFFSGPPAQILSHWRKRSFAAVISEPIILEYKSGGRNQPKVSSATIWSVQKQLTLTGSLFRP
ncbi:MAG: PIN domain-containing protein [Deltaproteobacteria bacterium]|nr:PIN domain-containing protein [Deltaproteobacteria bacterium]MBW1967716.1 PIN domain-containing protein [Deltaproteobacteria bacterium]